MLPYPLPQIAKGFEARAKFLANDTMVALVIPVIFDTLSVLYSFWTSFLNDSKPID
jgi:hypothetical protein